MSKPNTTLRPGTNIVLTVLWGIIAVMTFIMCGPPRPFLTMGVAALLGLLGGIMQTLGFREAKQRFLEPRTMLEVRSVLVSTKWGKRYIYFLWASHCLLLILSFLFTVNPIFSIPNAFFTFMFTREAITLKITFELSRMNSQRLEEA